MSRTGPSLRWWPLSAIVVLAAGALIFIWVADAPHRQNQVMQTLAVMICTLGLTSLWLLFLSRLRWKIRLLSAGAFALLGTAAAISLRIGGVSGDLVPILEWRWAEKAGGQAKAPAAPGAATTDTGSPPTRNDYPQFLGPQRNASVPGIRLARDWSRQAPRLLWRQSIGAGWSAFAVAGNVAITQEQHGEREMVICRDLHTGQILWSHADSTRYATTLAGIGPRATPTIAADRVYTLGATGLLNCLDLTTGAPLWQRDILADNDAEVTIWGVSGSPLVLDSLVVVSAGGTQGRSLVSYHKDTGAFVWGGGSDPKGYSSPQIATIAGVPQILIFNRGSVAAHHPQDGRVLWRREWPNGTECVAQPLPLPGDRVFVSSGYGIGCKLFQIQRHTSDSLQASLVWETTRFKAKFANFVHREGYIYGLDDGILACLDLRTGQRRWKRGRHGHGQVILVDDVLLVQAESGTLILVEANPQSYRELARLDALDDKTWNNPALAAPFLLVRNHREAACYELPLENASAGGLELGNYGNKGKSNGIKRL